MTCPSELELSRAITGGADPEADPEGAPEGDLELRAHLAACAGCRAAWDSTKTLIDLARELPAPLPPRARREEVRTAVLAAAASVTRRPARRIWLAPVVAGAAAASAIAYLAIPSGSPPPPLAGVPVPPARHSHGVLRPHPGARYLASAPGPDEIVRITDGIVDIEVEPLAPGERFRVAVGGAEIEVRGTAFTVMASAEHLTGVAVARGRVDVRPETGAPAVLLTGQSWRVAPVAAAEPAPPMIAPLPPPQSRTAPVPHRATIAGPQPSPRAAPGVARAAALAPPGIIRAAALAPPGIPRAAALAPPGIPREAALAPPGIPREAALAPPDDAEPRVAPEPALAGGASAKLEATAARNSEELSYDQAWEALRANNFTRAASGFSRVLLLAPDSALVEDASFWRAVALARGKRSAEALSAFRDFLDAYARSARAGEASAMLGWILIDARAFDEAERRFRAAAGDGSTAVRSSATAGLAALARRKR